MAESDRPCIIELGLIQGSQRYLTCENQMHGQGPRQECMSNFHPLVALECWA